MVRDTVSIVAAPPIDRAHLDRLIRRRAQAGNSGDAGSRSNRQGWFAGGRQPRDKHEAALWTNQELTKLFQGSLNRQS